MIILRDQIDAETSEQIFVHRAVCYKHCAQFTTFLGGGGLFTVYHFGGLEGEVRMWLLRVTKASPNLPPRAIQQTITRVAFA